MISRLSSLFIWAAVAACAAFWGLRLFVAPSPLPAGAALAGAPLPATADLGRLLGAPPAQALAEAAPPPADSRFRLLGLVAPRAGQSSGLALVSIDGKPARAWTVGRELEPGLRLLAVSLRQAEFGQQPGVPTMTLSLPAPADASRGRLGEADAPALPGLPLPALRRPGLAPGMAVGVPQQGSAAEATVDQISAPPADGADAPRR